tara:strand:+ start:284 stop:1864 length:1581 start_codon:yes stop_codon:yes gene_type:complete
VKKFFEAAIRNVYRHGDTDVFPFPIENRIIFDNIEKVTDLLLEAFESFDGTFAANAPHDLNSLVPAGTFGFRQGTQLDPFWNCYLLGIVLAIVEKIEQNRLGPDQVFSYRIDLAKYLEGDIFRKDISWIDFVRKSTEMAADSEYVLICDIADCYSRISHHKLENALQLIDAPFEVRNGIMSYLSALTQTRSSGLPIGGPAARILAELALVNADLFMQGSRINFFRYADDYHVFCGSRHEAYSALLTISKTLANEGLTLQKSKTRILSRAEFLAINKGIIAERELPKSPVQRLMSLTLRYDPYSANAEQDYEALKDELSEIDIVALLNEQLSQTRIHAPTTKKIIAALGYISSQAKFGAFISMLDNMDALYPIASNVFISINSYIGEIEHEQRLEICQRIMDLNSSNHEVMQVPTNLAFANRVIAQEKNAKNQEYLHACFDRSDDPIVRRDIILIFANWRHFAWLSMMRGKFTTLGLWERRALILASFYMKDEGKHWRAHAKNWFTPLEIIVRDWRAEKQPEFMLPL